MADSRAHPDEPQSHRERPDPQLEHTQTDETSEPTPQQFLERTNTDRSATSDRDRTATATITSFGDSQVVPEPLRADPARAARRYEILQQVGKGATSRVYAMRDNSLEREIAVKFLSGRNRSKESVAQRFLHEARVTAALQHPNIMPVYDIGVSPKGELFFAMKKIEGCSLGEAIRAAKEGRQVPEEFGTVDGRVRVFLKVCDALAYAHDSGFIHQDIKPDNIMLGRYGEVLLLDWGSAMHREGPLEGVERSLLGTPAYMSPEQARREHADGRSDVYCLGATFFHSLLLRHPTWDDDPERFWDKKRAGRIDVLSESERRMVPRALLGIVMKALEPDPGRRYQSAAALAEDLKRWQAGQAVSAHRESVVERFVRWYRHNRRLFWVSAGLSTAVFAIATLLLHEKIQEMVTWRRYAVEDFSGTTTVELARNWRAVSSYDWQNAAPVALGDSGSWLVVDGALHASADWAYENIAYRHRIPGDIRVEWDVTPVVGDGNVNCFIAGDNRYGGYMFHVGGFSDPYSLKLARMRSGMVDEARLPEAVVVGRTYRMRMEKEGRAVRLYLNGTRVMEYRDADDLQGEGHQTFGFECNFHRRQIIDNIRIYYHPLPLKVSPLAAADQFYELGYYRDALSKYRELAEVYVGNDVGRFAWFRYGRCLAKVDSVERALEELLLFEREYPRHELAPFACNERARILESRGDTAAAEDAYRELAIRFKGHPILRSAFLEMTAARTTVFNELAGTWIADSVSTRFAPRWVQRECMRMVALARVFGVDPDANEFLGRGVGSLFGAGEITLAELRTTYPELRTYRATLLHSLGDYEAVLDSFQDVTQAVHAALLSVGEYRQALDQEELAAGRQASALLTLGRYREVVEEFPAEGAQRRDALLALGRFEDAIQEYSDEEVYNAARARGRLKEVYDSPTVTGAARARLFIHQLHRSDSALAIMEAQTRKTVSDQVTELQARLYFNGEEQVLKLASGNPDMVAVCGEALRRLGRLDECLARYPRYAANVIPALRDKGEYESILRLYPERVGDCIGVLWRMARWDELARYAPRRKPLQADLYLWNGEYERVLVECPDERYSCAVALYRLGRDEELLAQYPHQRDVCAAALLRQGKRVEALERYPDCRGTCAWQLFEKGAYDSVVQQFPDQTTARSWALAELGRYSQIPVDTGFVLLSYAEIANVLYLRAMREWDNSVVRRVDSLVAAANRIHRSQVDMQYRFARFLLAPALHALAGDTAALLTACQRLCGGDKYHYAQQLWYEAAWLAGRINDSDFLAQPFRLDAGQRLGLLKAIRHDVAGRATEAVAGYRQVLAANNARDFLKWPESSAPLCEHVAVVRFVQRRLEKLGKG